MLRLIDRARWHVHGMLLWLLQRPYLRYLPVPYPSVTTLEQWKLQCGQMVASRSWSSAWIKKGHAAKQFTVSNLAELAGFRSRQGLHWTFLEDPLLQGMMAARQTKGAVSSLRKAAVAEAQEQALQAEKEGKRVEALRTLIGPKGGLPTLKADLLRLASLLHLKVNEDMKVEDLKNMCRPIVKDLKLDPSSSKTTSGSSSSQSAADPVAKAAPPTLPRSSQDPSSLQPEVQQVLMQDVHEMLTQQDQKFQTMMHQVMQHVMAIQSQPQPQHFQMNREEWEAAMEHDPQAENMMAHFGDLDFMSSEEHRQNQEHMDSWS